MKDRQSPPKTPAPSATRAAALLVLSLVCTPSLVYAGLNACASSRANGLEGPVQDLTVHRLDYGPANSDTAAIDNPGDRAIDDDAPISPASTLKPRVAVVLRKPFDDPDDLVQPAPIDGSESGPLADMIVPGAGGDGDKHSDAEAIPSEELPGVDMRLPGLSDDDVLRFKRQMYRTDI